MNNNIEKPLTREQCILWNKNPNNNPRSGRKLSEKSAILKKIKKECNSLYPELYSKPENIIKKVEINNSILELPLTKEECLLWQKDKTRNPRTKYLLLENGKLLNEIKKQCKEILIADNIIQQEDIPEQDNATEELKIKQKIKDLKEKLEIDIIEDIEEKSIKNKIKSLNKKLDEIKKNKINVIVKPSTPPKSIINKVLDSNSFDELYYPDIKDPNFRDKLTNLYEYNIHTIPKYNTIKNIQDFNINTNKLCGDFEKTFYQYLISHYISVRSPYNSILLYHGVGVGKTCSAITLSENFLLSHSQYNDPKIWVIMPSALRGSFKEQIFSLLNITDYKSLANQCTGDTYIKLANILKETDKDKINNKIKKLINNRYRIFTYDEFAKFIETEYANIIVENKVIIIDEAHNIRNSSKNEDKRIYSAITKALSNGINNKLILLSATPMYNEPGDILDLLYLFLLNDKREELLKIIKPPFPSIFNNSNKINDDIYNIIKQLSQTYISFLRGKNPFTFATELSPKDSNIKILDKIILKDPSDKLIPLTDRDWLYKIKNGIITSELGEYQKKFIFNKKELDENNVLANLQPMNIVYNNETGSKGFSTFFSRIDTTGTNSIHIKYNTKYIDGLFPDNENLGKCSGKFLKIANFIMKSNGIVVIYSRFVEGGVLPMAIILEHMGFIREGEKNILSNPKIISNPPKYGYKNKPKYCILTSPSELNNVMGSSTIDKLLPIINSPKNINGELLKIILMTPVASEGLSFYNTREMHLIEPWYHFNKIKQIIGRGIRNCRHNSLPLENRNMTVFMHASIDGYDKETPDIHAFRISSKKLIQTDIIDEIIKDNAMDCFMMKNINYFPKSIFDFNININTSQGIKKQYNYGDDVIFNPKCDINISNSNKLGFRKETYKHLIFNMKNIIKSLILKYIHNGDRFLPIDIIIKNTNYDYKIIYEAIKQSVYPNILFEKYIIIPHNNGIHIIDINIEKPKKIRIINNIENIQIEKGDIDKLNLSNIDMKSVEETTISIYLAFNSKNFIEFVKKIIETKYILLNEQDKHIANCLFIQGALIHKNEVKSNIIYKDYEFVGYVDIYDTKTDFKLYLYNFNTNRYSSLSPIDTELHNIINNRNKITIPDMDKETISVGIIVPKIDKQSIYNNVLKILTAGVANGKKTGIVCTSLSKSELNNLIEELSIVPKTKITKTDNCNYIAVNMLKINKIYLYPYYKPKL